MAIDRVVSRTPAASRDAGPAPAAAPRPSSLEFHDGFQAAAARPAASGAA